MIDESVELVNSNGTTLSKIIEKQSNLKLDKTNIRIGIIGGGSWATALAKIILTNVKYINWYLRREEKIDEFIRRGRNPSYLTGVKFNTDRITFSTDINKVVKQSDIVLFASPSPFLKSHLEKLNRTLENKVVISAIKGIVPQENMLVSDYLIKEYGLEPDNCIVLGGPCHAEEVALERKSYLTIAGKSRDRAREIATFFENEYVHTRISDDVYGLEYTSVMKNIYAIVAGICHGLKYGDNFQAVLISNAVQEMNRFCTATNPQHRDISESAFLGDLLVTAYSKFSRNRLFGNMIGQGYSVKTAQIEMEMIAEGYYATNTIHELNKTYHVNIPIVDAVYDILYNKALPSDIINKMTEKLQ